MKNALDTTTTDGRKVMINLNKVLYFAENEDGTISCFLAQAVAPIKLDTTMKNLYKIMLSEKKSF